jgi:hypothetical protein
LAVKLVLALKVREFSDSQIDFKGKGKNINSLQVFSKLFLSPFFCFIPFIFVAYQ